jgi:hypothetical protein
MRIDFLLMAVLMEEKTVAFDAWRVEGQPRSAF